MKIDDPTQTAAFAALNHFPVSPECAAAVEALNQTHNADVERDAPKAPEDWNEDYSCFRGYSRVARLKCYSIDIVVNGKQARVGYVRTDQIEAAELYDLALWRLLPFTASRARPNFPAQFGKEDRHNAKICAERLPLAERLYQWASAEALASGVNETALREQRMTQLASKGKLTGKAAQYQAASTALRKYLYDVQAARLGINKALFPLILRTLPDVAEARDRLGAALAEAERAIGTLSEILREDSQALGHLHELEERRSR